MRTGELFADRYRVESSLGQGGMGEVFLALDERLGRQVALKVMKPSVAEDPGMRARFAREAASAARLAHPNVVAVHDYGEHLGQPYVVMGYVAGRDLGEELAEVGAIGLSRTVAVIGQAAAGLDAVHGAGHVHRDIKPANILLHQEPSGQERALISDFGLVLSPTDSAGATSTGSVVGTLRYLSPEQLRGEQATVRSDVYALACVTFECLTGRPPFTGATDVEVAQKHLTQAPETLRELLTGVPSEVAAVVVRGLAKEPARRTVTAGDFAEDLASAARAGLRAAEPARGRRGRDTQVLDLAQLGAHPAGRPARRSTGLRWLAVAAVVAFAAAAAAASFTALGDDADTAPPPRAASTDERASLTARLPESVFSDCRPHPEREGPGRRAAVTCTTPRPGADELLVTQWTDEQTMAADFATTYGAKPDGKCGRYTGEPASGIRSTWGDGAPLACYVNSEDAAILMWEYPEQALQVLAVRRDRDSLALFEWWESAVLVPLDEDAE